ncbi:L10-interacting MYB domain-containing protein-like isoform X1 [Sesamum indicum]|uniref:L10-interacting MYB domain-containing protein-like isoform X1 n=2 Tax=Sesamum indicum TaxID=4182 RepID=A0A6I9UI00_SESIN|nr:L10-interacting MYB domain-containing protein-like isoform X1 [Sesamum indicum]
MAVNLVNFMTTRTTRSRKPDVVQQPENQLRAKWTAPLTKTLVDLMVDQIQKGNRSNKSFSKRGWKFICDNFRIQTGYWWDNDQLKSRYVALRKQYINVSLLLDHPDFKWDEATGAITSTEEAWDRYIKDHPDAETLKSMGCPIFNQLRMIFAEAGRHQKQNGSTKENETMPCSPGDQIVKVEQLSPSESENYADPASRKRGRKGVEDAIARGILEMATATRLRAEAIKNFNGKFSITDCVRALDQLQGVDDQVYHAALDLFNNRNARETFLTLRVEKRSIWLQRKCFNCTLP